MLLLLLLFGFVINDATRVYLGSTCSWIFDVVADEVLYGGVATASASDNNNVVICAFGGGMKAIIIAAMGDGDQRMMR